MIVSEVMSPPDCHADPTTQHGAWFLSGRHMRHPPCPCCLTAPPMETAMRFRVEWMIEVDAKTPAQAAARALK